MEGSTSRAPRGLSRGAAGTDNAVDRDWQKVAPQAASGGSKSGYTGGGTSPPDFTAWRQNILLMKMRSINIPSEFFTAITDTGTP